MLTNNDNVHHFFTAKHIVTMPTTLGCAQLPSPLAPTVYISHTYTKSIKDWSCPSVICFSPLKETQSVRKNWKSWNYLLHPCKIHGMVSITLPIHHTRMHHACSLGSSVISHNVDTLLSWECAHWCCYLILHLLWTGACLFNYWVRSE